MSRYRLVGRLENGELAELYRAARDDGTTVTIKLFHEKTSDAAYARALANTARILNPLAHEGLLHYLEIGTVKQRLAVVREHAEGFSLGQALQRLATKEVLLPPAVALYIIIELLEAVQRGHEAGCIHGAITPGNIALTRDGKAQVSDFGALRALEASPALKAFLNKGRGTYRAPEVAKGEEVSPEADVYSLGAIAYELLTLRELNPGKGMSVRREAIPPPSRLDRRINSRLDPIIMRAVDLQPGRRYRQCSEMVTALRNFLSATGGMPSKDDVRKFVRELFPNEVKSDVLGPVPFAEEFELKQVSGAADLPELQQDRSEAVEPRPAFSGEFAPDLPGDTADDELSEVSGSRRDTLQASPAFVAPGSNRPKDEPKFDDGTSPGHAGPLEEGWDAPAAASAPKGPKLRPQGASKDGAAALKGRVRVVEDFAPLPTMSQEIRQEDAREVSAKKRRPTPAPAPAAAKDSYAADPGPTSAPGSSAVTSGPQKLTTVEKRVKARGELQRKMILAAAAVAVVGLAAFGYAIGKFKDRKPVRDPDTSVQIVDPNTVKPQPRKDPVVVKKDDPPPKTVERDEPPPAKLQTPSKKDVGYLSIASNMSAWVYVDGAKLKSKTPIRRHPVASGSRTIMLESVLTGERKKFKLDVARGKEVKIAETFEKKPRR